MTDSGSRRLPLLFLAVGAAGIVAIIVMRSRAREIAQTHDTRIRAKTPSAASPNSAHSAGPAVASVIRGKVLDGKSEKPVPGASLLFHRPRPARPGESVRHNLAAWVRTPDGRGLQSIGTCFRHDDASEVAYDRPQAGIPALIEVESDASGAFELALPIQRGILECRHPDYMTAFRPLYLDWKEGEFTVRLFKGAKLRGRVVGVDGEAVTRKLQVAFLGYAPQHAMTAGIWETETNFVGEFEVEVAAQAVMPKIQTPGWRIRTPERPVDVSDEPLVIVARRVPVLRVFDALTREPIEKFTWLMTEGNYPGGYNSGEVYAPGGVMPLLAETIPDESYRTFFKIRVWAEGTAVFEKEVPDLLASEDVLAALVRGELPVVAGVVRRKGAPIEGAEVSIRTGNFGNWEWSPSKLRKLGSGVTGSDGAFKLGAPAGQHVLIVRVGSLEHGILIESPSPLLVIDLDQLAEIHVRVRDAAGKSLAGVLILVKAAESGRRWYADSDPEGLARFENIAPGDIWIVPGKLSYPGVNEYTTPEGQWKKFHAAPGQITFADVIIEEPGPPKPVPARLTIQGVSNLDGWKVIDASVFREEALLKVGPDGRFEVPNRAAGISIVAPWGDRWSLVPPADSGNLWNAELSPEGPGYEGVLKDRATGKPLAGFTLRADRSDPTSGVWGLTTKSDSEGRFRLRGLNPIRHRISITSDKFYGISFEPAALPSTSPTKLDLAVPMWHDDTAFEGIPNRPMTGRLLDSSTQAPCANAHLTLFAVWEASQGRFVARLKISWAVTDGEGKFSTTVPAGKMYRAHVVTDIGRPESKWHQKEWTSPPGEGALNVEIRVP